MKHAVIAAMMLAAPAWAAKADEASAQKIVQAGEVLGSRPFIQPTLGFELLIRHNGGLFVCSVKQDTRFGYNGQPNVDFVAVGGCVSQAAD